MLKRNKEAKTHRWYETNDPAKAIGLWSHFKTFTTTLHPIDPTRQTMGRFFNDDLAKFETMFEALRMQENKPNRHFFPCRILAIKCRRILGDPAKL